MLTKKPQTNVRHWEKESTQGKQANKLIVISQKREQNAHKYMKKFNFINNREMKIKK